MKRLLFIVIALTACYHYSYSQNDTVLFISNTDSVKFHYQQSNGVDEQISNYFITELSRGIPKILEYTSYDYHYHYSILIRNITKSKDKPKKRFELQFRFNDGYCDGDIKYRGYSVAGVLLPSYAEFTLELTSNLNTTLIAQSGKIKIKVPETLWKWTFTDSSLTTSFNALCKPKQFFYNDSCKEAFKKRIQLINDYYQTEYDIATANEKLKTINLDNVEMIKVYSFTLSEVEKIVSTLDKKEFEKQLVLSSYDPLNYIDSIHLLHQNTQKYRLMINNMLASMDQMYYQKGMECLTNVDTACAEKFFEKSINANAFYSPSYLQQSKIYFSRNEFEKAVRNITTIVAKLSPDPVTLKHAVSLGSIIYDTLLARAGNKISKEQYFDALNELKLAKDFCDSTKGINCTELLQKNVAFAKYGIYKSFITVSQKALEKKVIDIAEIYIIKALDYQYSNSQDIISASEADALLIELVNMISEQAGLLCKSGLYDSALVILDTAHSLCLRYPKAPCGSGYEKNLTIAKKGKYNILVNSLSLAVRNKDAERSDSILAVTLDYHKRNENELLYFNGTDSLISKIKQLWHDKYIVEGLSYISYNGEKALRFFELSKDLEKNYTLQNLTSLDSLIVASARPYILDVISKGAVNVWGNELNKAATVLDSATKLSILYGLNTDSIVVSGLSGLKEKIHDQQCRNAIESFTDDTETAMQKILIKQYNTGYSLLINASKTIATNSDCGIKDSTLKKLISQVTKPAYFQTKAEASEKFAAEGNYADALNTYIEAETYFNSNNIKSYGITVIPVMKYLSKQENTHYIFFAANYYYTIDSLDNALQLLKSLEEKSFESNATISLQKALGKKYADTDHAAGSLLSGSELIEQRIGKSSWFSEMKKAYLAEFKLLKK